MEIKRKAGEIIIIVSVAWFLKEEGLVMINMVREGEEENFQFLSLSQE